MDLMRERKAIEIIPTTTPLTIEQIDLINEHQTPVPSVEYNGGWQGYEDEYDFIRPLAKGVVIA